MDVNGSVGVDAADRGCKCDGSAGDGNCKASSTQKGAAKLNTSKLMSAMIAVLAKSVSARVAL